MIIETTFTRDYRQGLTLEEVSLLQSLKANSLEAAIQELKEVCQSLYEKLKNMTTDAFAEIDFFGEEEAYE